MPAASSAGVRLVLPMITMDGPPIASRSSRSLFAASEPDVAGAGPAEALAPDGDRLAYAADVELEVVAVRLEVSVRELVAKAGHVGGQLCLVHPGARAL